MLQSYRHTKFLTFLFSDVLCDDDDLDRNFFHEVRDIKNFISDKDTNDQMKL